MWPLGHAAIAYLCYAVLQRVREVPQHGLAVGVLMIGSQFPDLIDKPLSWELGLLPTGRSLAHSLLLVVPLVALVFVVAARYDRTEYGTAFGIGAITHLLADAIPVFWGEAELAYLLWPLIAVEPYPDGAPAVGGLLIESLQEPYLLVEFALAGLAIGIWWREGTPGLTSLRQLVDKRQ